MTDDGRLVHTLGVLASLVLGAALVASSPASAEPLRWDATEGCPDSQQGRELVEGFLRAPLPVDARVIVRLAAVDGEHEATVRVGESQRTLRAADCRTVARAAALVVAVSVDAVATAASVRTKAEDRTRVPEPPATPDDPREPEPTTTAADDDAELRALERDSGPAPSRSRAGSADRPVAGREPSGEHWLGAAAGVARSRAPALTAALRLHYAWQQGALRLEASGHYEPPRELDYPQAPGIGGRFQSAALGGRGCFAPTAGRVVLPVCGGVEAGAVVGQGVGIEQRRLAVGAWLAVVAGAGAAVRVHPRLALTLGVDLLATLRRPAFHVGQREPLMRSPAAGVRGTLGLEVRLR